MANYREPLVASSSALILAGAMLVLPVAADAADWPQWRGPNRDGITTEAISVWPPTEAWRKDVGDTWASVVVSEGRVYAQGDIMYKIDLRCLDPATGDEIWSALVAEGNTFPKGTPVVSGGRVYVLSWEGVLFCFDAADGTEYWSTDAKAGMGSVDMWGYSSSPLLEGNLVIVNVGGQGVAFDKDTGAKVWANPGNGHAHSSPLAYDSGGQRMVAVGYLLYSGDPYPLGVRFLLPLDPLVNVSNGAGSMATAFCSSRKKSFPR